MEKNPAPLRIATGLSALPIFSALASRENSGSSSSAFGVFLEKRRSENSSNNVKTSIGAIRDEWAKLKGSEKQQFEQEARDRRKSTASGAGEFLKRQQEEQKHLQRVSPIDPNEAPLPAKRARASKKEIPVQVPLPSFPAASRLTLPWPDRSEKRRKMIRAHAEDRSAQVGTASSHSLDLADVCSRLSAPSLSFDWQLDSTGDDADGENDLPAARNGEDAPAGDLLTVDVPKAPTNNSGIGRFERSLLRQELQQRVSCAQVRNLLQPPALGNAGA